MKGKEWHLEFEDDGLFYKVGYGYLAVFKNGKRIFQILDCFVVGKIPTKEQIINVYKSFSNLSEKIGENDIEF